MLKPLALAATLLTAPAFAQGLTDMTDAERTAFGDEVRAYLLENPEVLMEALSVLESREQQAQAASDEQLVAQFSEQLFNDGFSWVDGPADADVTVVEFMDYRCGYCRRAHPDVQALIDSDADIRLIVKEFPILGEDSLLASRYAIATQIALGDEAYGQIHNALMTENVEMTESGLSALASDLGLNADTIAASLEDPEVARRIAQTRALGQAMGINGTPSFVIGDQMVRGYVPLEGMMQIVDEVRG